MGMVKADEADIEAIGLMMAGTRAENLPSGTGVTHA
jgi:hypothetical protein